MIQIVPPHTGYETQAQMHMSSIVQHRVVFAGETFYHAGRPLDGCCLSGFARMGPGNEGRRVL
jgi:hypothetical protein